MNADDDSMTTGNDFLNQIEGRRLLSPYYLNRAHSLHFKLQIVSCMSIPLCFRNAADDYKADLSCLQFGVGWGNLIECG